jgi:hypothetical protein
VVAGEYRLKTWLLMPLDPATVRTPDGVVFPKQLPDNRPLPRIPPAVALTGDVPVTIIQGAGNVDEVEVLLRPAARFIGQVQFEPELPPALREHLPKVPVTVRPLDRSLPPIPVSGLERDGRFETVGLPPGRYEVRILTSLVKDIGQWYRTSIQVAGREARAIHLGNQDQHVLFTMSNQFTDVSISVTDQAGQPVPRAVIVVFRQDEGLWEDLPAFRLYADDAGRYHGTELSRGDFFLAAVTAAPVGWNSAESLRGLVARATPVRIAPGLRLAIVLRTAPETR